MEKANYSGMQPTGQPGTYQPQPGTVVVTQPGTVASGPTAQPPSPILPIVLSCFVTWCCCCCLGLAAFIIAILGTSAADYEEAARKYSLANKLSIAGIVVGVIILIISVISSAASGGGGSA